MGNLAGKIGDGLREFITDLINSIHVIGTPTPAKISQLISDAINKALGNALDTDQAFVDVELSMGEIEAQEDDAAVAESPTKESAEDNEKGSSDEG